MRHLGVACAVALLAGCSGSTSVRPFGGSYELISVDGQRDPQPLDPGTTTPDLVGGTLNVGADSLDVTLKLQPVDSAGRRARSSSLPARSRTRGTATRSLPQRTPLGAATRCCPTDRPHLSV